MNEGHKADIVGRIEMGRGLLMKDIAAMPNEVLSHCPGGKARCGFDLVYEMAMVHRLVADTLRGEAKDVPPPQGWIKAPAEFNDKEMAAKEFSASVDEMLMAFADVNDDQLGAELPTPLGPMSIQRLMTIMGGHLMYHSGQLNYIQTLHGDDVFHWMDA